MKEEGIQKIKVRFRWKWLTFIESCNYLHLKSYEMKSIIFLSALFLSLSVSAQIGNVGGMVTTANGEPLPGTGVAVVGTGTSSLTNVDGRYLLAVPKGTVTLRFTYVGCISLDTTVVVGDAAKIVNIMLSCDALMTFWKKSRGYDFLFDPETNQLRPGPAIPSLFRLSKFPSLIEVTDKKSFNY